MFAVGSYVYWDPAVSGVRQAIESLELLRFVLDWLSWAGIEQLSAVVAPWLVLALLTPLMVISALLLVAWITTPKMVEWVARRRFPDLERRHGGHAWGSLLVSVQATLVAVVMLVLTLPLWLLPPLMLLLPALISGWLGYRVFSYDVLSEFASADERAALMKAHRWPLLGMGVLSGVLGSAPGVVWTSGILFVALAPLLIPLALWIYAWVFALASLWFAHYLLAALEQWRARPFTPPSGPVVVEAGPLLTVEPDAPTPRPGLLPPPSP